MPRSTVKVNRDRGVYSDFALPPSQVRRISATNGTSIGMPSNFNTFKYAFLGTVLFAVTLITAYQFLYGIPQKKCEAAGDWWSFRYRQCAHPLRLEDLTGRHRKAAAGAASSMSAPPAPSISASTSAAGHP
jgi:hypothetical protein